MEARKVGTRRVQKVRYRKSYLQTKRPVFFKPVTVERALPEVYYVFSVINLPVHACTFFNHDWCRSRKLKRNGQIARQQQLSSRYFFLKGSRKYAFCTNKTSIFSWLHRFFVRKRCNVYQRSRLRNILHRIFRNVPPDKMTAYATQSEASARTHPHNVRFDSDSQEILVDSGTSHTISPHRKDFIEYHPIEGTVCGVGGNAKLIGAGTVSYTIEDDNGETFTIVICDAIHVPESPY